MGNINFLVEELMLEILNKREAQNKLSRNSAV